MMRRGCLLASVVGLGFAAPNLVGAEDLIAALKDLTSRQKALLGEAEKKTSQAELEDLRQPIQDLCFAYEDLLKKHPDEAAVYVGYGMLLSHPLLDERRRAATLLLRANQLDPDLPVVKNQLGNYLAEEGKPLEAVNYFMAAIRLDPRQALYHYQLGTLLAEARDTFLQSGEWTATSVDSALQGAFEEAMRLAPDDWRYAYRYGMSFYDVEKPDWERALTFWQRFEGGLKAGVEQQTARLHQARIHFLLGHSDDAKAILSTVSEPILAKQKERLLGEFQTKD